MKKLREIARKLRDLRSEYSRLNWTKYTTGFDFGIDDAYTRILELLKSGKSWDLIQNLRDADLEPLDRRRVEIMENTFKPYHLSERLNELTLEMMKMRNSLSSVLNTHRCRIDGREVSSSEIAKVLSSEPDREIRKKFLLARTQVNRPLVDAGFLELITLRKEYASEYGSADYVEYQLERQELDPGMFDNWIDDVREVLPLMNRLSAEFSEETIGVSDPMPWDYAFISANIAPELNHRVDMLGFFEPVHKLFNRFGFDVSDMNIIYDVFPRKNKSEWGYNFPIETGADSRILANVSDRFFEFGVLLHETGHGLHNFALDRDEAILNMGVSGIVSEGIAILFGRLLKHVIFFSQFFEKEMDKAERNFTRVKTWNRANQLRSVARILFDQSLYRNSVESIDDVHHLVWKMNRDLLDKAPYADEPLWGFLIHYTTHPIYLHNYLLGDLTCDMLEDVFAKREGIDDVVDEAESFGKFLLDEVIGVTGRYRFPELFRRISGEGLSLRFLTDRLKKETS